MATEMYPHTNTELTQKRAARVNSASLHAPESGAPSFLSRWTDAEKRAYRGAIERWEAEGGAMANQERDCTTALLHLRLARGDGEDGACEVASKG